MKLIKKILSSYSFYLIIFLLFILIIGYGALLRYHYLGGTKFKYAQKVALFFADLPTNIKIIISSKNLNPDRPPVVLKGKEKKKFKKYFKSDNHNNALLVLPKYDHSLGRGVIEIIDLKNFEVIHTYKHDIEKMNDLVTNTKEFPRIKIDDSPIRFEYRHPLLLHDGSIISDSDYSVEFKIDFCSNLVWINEEEIFHHSKELDHEGNIYIPGQLNPKSKYVKNQNIYDDAIIKINTDGRILYKKSIIEILIERDLKLDNFTLGSKLLRGFQDPVHLNDIQPALSSTAYWNVGDLFLSSPVLAAIIHYRPSTNEVVNYITGPFSAQHDVDIISDKEISIFNNNNWNPNGDTKYSEIIIYNFETKTFRKLFNEQLKKENFKTGTQGLSHIFKDGALLVEEQNYGRIILFDNKGKKEWEYVNKDKNGDIGFISWSRVIEDKVLIEKFKSLVKLKKCSN